ncbi:MAG: indole-3-glycerol phosphate synthase TrpC [Ginsengibacter sp.]
MNILDTIIAKKRAEVERTKLTKSVADLEKGPFFKNETLSFAASLLRTDKTGIIAEFKRRSPSRGAINEFSSVTEVTKAYTKYGASAISILTDNEFFGGSLADLLEATVNEIPLLRKDFMIDEYQLIESKAFGAEVILLIASCLSLEESKHLAAFAKNIGLNVLLEIHSEDQLEYISEDIDVVGVNNRDLKTFIVDVNHSVRLAGKIPKNKIKISESGIDNVETIKLLRDNGYNGFLVGEKFMRENEPGQAFKNFSDALMEQK